MKKKVAKLGQERQNVLIEKVSDHITKNLKAIDEKQGANLKAFMTDLPGELRITCWSKMQQGSGTENLELAKQIHKYCVDGVLEAFGVSGAAASKALAATPKKKSEK